MKNLSGVSLFEVLIILIIVSVTSVTAMSLFITSTLRVREGEIKEMANGVVVKVLELMRSPTNVKISANIDQMPSSNFKSYKIVSSGNTTFLSFEPEASQITDCDESSPFYFQSEQVSQTEERKFLICVQLRIRRAFESVDRELFEAVITSAYGFPGSIKTDNFKTYRFYEFERIE